MANPPAPLGPTPRGIPAVDPLYRHLMARGKLAAPAVRVYNSTNKTFGTGMDLSLYFDSERFDTDGMHSTTVNQHRLTAVTPGIHQITGHIYWVANDVGRRMLWIRYNGAVDIAKNHNDHAGSMQGQVITTLYALAVGDWVDLRARQDSGGNLDVWALPNYSPEFMMHWVAPLP